MITVHPVRDSKGKITAYFQILRSLGIPHPLTLSHMAGVSPIFKQLMRSIEALAPIDTPVLIRGEIGSGKELVARTLHRLSLPKRKRFVPLDCIGLSERAFQVEMFGKDPLAYLEAPARSGLVDVAQGGVLFLREMGDIGLSSQVMLLVLIETGFFCRFGGSQLFSADVRLICSTHCDLEQKVERGDFSPDLFDHLSQNSITVPPLRERLQDLPILIGNLLHHLSRGRVNEISPAALALLSHHSFPGNIRELIGILEHACLFADGSTILPEHLPLEYRGGVEE